MVQKLCTENELFSMATAKALREYADAIENKSKGLKATEEFTSSNDCIIRVIHGYRTPEKNTKVCHSDPYPTINLQDLEGELHEKDKD